MIFTDLRVPASGPRNAKLACIGMAPQRTEVADKRPFTGPSGRLFDESLLGAKANRSQVFVTNLCEFYIDNNDLYSVPEEVMAAERARVFRELDAVQPNCLLIQGSDTLDLLTAGAICTVVPKTGKYAGQKRLDTVGSKAGIIKWRGSIFELQLPSGRKQKCVASMHPASFLRGQWKWLPLYRYIDVPRAVTNSSFPELRLKSRECITGPSFQQATDWLRLMNEQSMVAIDYEGIDFLSCLGSSSTSGQAMCVPLNRVGSSSYWNISQEVVIWKLWCQLLQNPKVKKIAQNAPFEWLKSWLHGIYPNPLGIDTQSLHHCLYPDWGGAADWLSGKRDIDNPGHSLALITSQYTDQPYYKDDGRAWTPTMGEHTFWQYNCTDVMVTFEAAEKMWAEAGRKNLHSHYEAHYLANHEKVCQMEWDGILIDIKRRDEVRAQKQSEIAKDLSELQDLLSMPVIARADKKAPKGALNLASPAQLKAFFLKKGYKIGVNRQTGAPKLDKDDMAALAAKHDDPTIQLIQRIRKAVDFISDNLDVRLDSNNRTHGRWNIPGTNGLRWSGSTSMLGYTTKIRKGYGRNLQNLDRQGPTRSLYLPD